MHGFRTFVVLLPFLLISVASTSYVETLPVYRVKAHKIDKKSVVKLAKHLFDLDETTKTNSSNTVYVVSSGDKSVGFDSVSGGVWAADSAELWNPEHKPHLIGETEALKKADKLVSKYNLIPRIKGPTKISGGRTSGTFVAKESKESKREEWPLDISVTYDITLDLPSGEYPIVDGRGKFR